MRSCIGGKELRSVISLLYAAKDIIVLGRLERSDILLVETSREVREGNIVRVFGSME